MPIFGLALSLGGGSKTVDQKRTVGQQLVDLKKAKVTGAIFELFCLRMTDETHILRADSIQTS